MGKKIVIIIIIAMVMVMTSSGCIKNTKANSTWGEKKINMDLIKVSNETYGKHSEEDSSVYFVSSEIINRNSFEALNPKMKVITYYSNGTVFAVNDTPYIEPKNIPAKGASYLYAEFSDPDNQIASFKILILDAKGEL